MINMPPGNPTSESAVFLTLPPTHPVLQTAFLILTLLCEVKVGTKVPLLYFQKITGSRG